MKIYSNNKAFDDIVNGIVDYVKDNGVQCIIVKDIIKDDEDEDIYVIFGLNNLMSMLTIMMKLICFSL